MAQLAEPNKQKALCPFYGSSHGCPYLNQCELSHSNPNSIELCPNYQTSIGCTNPSSCYYRHSLTPLSSDEQHQLIKRHKISGGVKYVRVIKGPSVHRVTLIINQVLWYGIHFIIEDARLQKIHYQKYSNIYHWSDALLVSELIADIIMKCKCPGKYLSYLKNLIDGDTEPGRNKKNEKLIHYRDILSSIGNKFSEIPKPINPHLLSNLSRVPWVDFKLLPLIDCEAYQYPDVYLKAGDLVRIWRPKKFVYHCGVYLGNKQIIHISNGVEGDQGLNWRLSGLFQSGSTVSSPQKSKQYYDYGKRMKLRKKRNEKEQDIKAQQIQKNMDREGTVEDMQTAEVYQDEDDMDLVNSCDLIVVEPVMEDEDECKRIELEATNPRQLNGEEIDEKQSALLYEEDMDESQANHMSDKEMEYARRARQCEWKEFISGSRAKDLELGFFVFPWRTPVQIVYTAQFLTEIHYMKGQYSVYKNNCEHFALYCCTGLRYSPQANTLEKVLNITSKIGSFAGSILSRATSFRKSGKATEVVANDKVELEMDHRRQHPVIRSQVLDDGGDDELEQILLNEDDKKEKKNGAKMLNKPKPKCMEKPEVEIEAAKDDKSADSGDDMIISMDEYADDEEDAMAHSAVSVFDLSHMTPGGLTQSEVMVAQKHQNQHKWNI